MQVSSDFSVHSILHARQTTYICLVFYAVLKNILSIQRWPTCLEETRQCRGETPRPSAGCLRTLRLQGEKTTKNCFIRLRFFVTRLLSQNKTTDNRIGLKLLIFTKLYSKSKVQFSPLSEYVLCFMTRHIYTHKYREHRCPSTKKYETAFVNTVVTRYAHKPSMVATSTLLYRMQTIGFFEGILKPL